MKHWKTTVFGAVTGAAWMLAGYGLYRDLSGLPKSPTAAKVVLCVMLVAGISTFLHGLCSADKHKEP